MADQVHAYVDGGILPSRRRLSFHPLELWSYRVLGIRLLVWTYGADVRTRDKTVKLGEYNCCTDCTQVGLACICDSERWRENYARVARTATAVFSMGDMIEYTPGSRNDLFFWPIDLTAQEGRRYDPVYPRLNKYSSKVVPMKKHLRSTNPPMLSLINVSLDFMAMWLWRPWLWGSP